MKIVIFVVLFLSASTFSEELPNDILVGRWNPIVSVKPEFKNDEFIDITKTTISWMGCQPVKYHLDRNFEASKFTKQYDGGPVVDDFKVLTIRLEYEESNTCLKNYKHIEFAFWIKDGRSPETQVNVTLYRSSNEWYAGKNYQTNISKM